ncbi:YppE family protein [Halobacillus litoralis]|uniref:YppE family protein n=1 Tax=Halobacillus litoralis TaxID=45668 RepID=UPI001CFE204E|nr:YppE family protein [Halobacillus litoralis]
MSLKQHTEEMKQLIDQQHIRFLNTEGPVDKKSHEFFSQVKNETAPMFELNNAWMEEAEAFVKNRKARVHPNQVKSTHENMEMIILHSYYLDVPRKRFKELYQSSHYVLDMILSDLEQQ